MNTVGTFAGIQMAAGAGDILGLDDFQVRTSSGTTGITWDGLPHAEAGQTNKSLVFTFKGTARDGLDPGADLTTLALMTQGVPDPYLVKLPRSSSPIRSGSKTRASRCASRSAGRSAAAGWAASSSRATRWRR